LSAIPVAIAQRRSAALGARRCDQRALAPMDFVEMIENSGAVDQRLAAIEHQRRHAPQRIVLHEAVAVAEAAEGQVLEGRAVARQRQADAADERAVELADELHQSYHLLPTLTAKRRPIGSLIESGMIAPK
jgi:hypothetical protein